MARPLFRTLSANSGTRLWNRSTLSVSDNSDLPSESDPMRHLTAIKAFMCSDDGATAAEYAVMLAAVFLALIVGATLFGEGVELWWTRNKTEIEAI